jgi:hypothetical protein
VGRRLRQTQVQVRIAAKRAEFEHQLGIAAMTRLESVLDEMQEQLKAQLAANPSPKTVIKVAQQVLDLERKRINTRIRDFVDEKPSAQAERDRRQAKRYLNAMSRGDEEAVARMKPPWIAEAFRYEIIGTVAKQLEFSLDVTGKWCKIVYPETINERGTISFRSPREFEPADPCK